ncbi:hypothetical protein KVT40_004650 [Elsinoe batatas]|uniref:Uncharacterized protein n=1 Tax=Elsinoe batatas TaxID=2601811 RepID=A0A8K0PG38_9PEZI|nr:hypothetical protein KVT40_004650 [Elsinoe batatas]
MKLYVLCYAACTSLLVARCHSQIYRPYENLPLASFASSGGNFSFPAGSTQIFDQGTPMTIRWTTSFSAVNLYVVYNASSNPPQLGIQRQLATGYSSEILDWTVSCEPYCDAPFALKAVDAFGDSKALANGGFFSRQFWVRPNVTKLNTQTSSSGASTSTISSPTSSSMPVTTSATTVVATQAPIPATNTSSTPTSTPDPSPSTNVTTIGAAIGAGVGVALLSAIAFFVWRRRNAKARYSHGPVMSSDRFYSPLSHDTYKFDTYPPSTSELAGSQAEPQELPSRRD